MGSGVSSHSRRVHHIVIIYFRPSGSYTIHPYECVGEYMMKMYLAFLMV